MPLGAQDPIDMHLVRQQWPRPADGSSYLNMGSCGRKPVAVLEEISRAWMTFNTNPTYYTFNAQDWLDDARSQAAELLGVNSATLLLTQNSTQGLHLVLNSFLQESGDELITTTHEHGSVNTIARYLSAQRGIIIRRHQQEPDSGSEVFCRSLISLVTERTRLIQVSEVNCYSGWHPDLQLLVDWCNDNDMPLLVDGAHAIGQGVCRPVDYPFWATSGHKWLGGPNGTGLLYARPQYEIQLQPVWIGDRFYNDFENPLMRFEFQGTSDVVRWRGLLAALKLHSDIGPERIAARQLMLTDYLRRGLLALPGAHIRTPHRNDETRGIVTVTWEPSRVKVSHLKDYLWQEHQIWTQPDFLYGEEGHGLRISCHISVEEEDIDRLCGVLRSALC